MFVILLFHESNSFQENLRESHGKTGYTIIAPPPSSKAVKEQRTINEDITAHDPTPVPVTRNRTEGIAFLVFRFPKNSGQGTGNIMSGVLAAQLLAEEFNRTICHIGQGTTNVHASFRRAFEWRDNSHKEVCNQILRNVEQTQKNNTSSTHNDTIAQRNYDATSEQSECAMRDLLSDHDGYPIIYYEGNTYPRWPNTLITLPRDYFHEQFRPTQALWNIMPWKGSHPPQVVIHLREGDDIGDQREGLDDSTLSLLGTTDFFEKSHNPNKTVFLVTNNVEWYSRFPEWSHPDWKLVHHSALKRIYWGRNLNGHPPNHHDRNEGDSDLQMWADWYTLLNAQKIYHTHSDFSRSAARWNEKIQSWTILGSTDESRESDEGEVAPRLLLRNDVEPVPNERKSTYRLVDRTIEDLWFCGNPSPDERRTIQEKRDRQLLHLIMSRKRRTGSFGH